MNTPTKTNNPVQIGSYRCGPGAPLLLIAGPCVLESETLALEIAETLQEGLSSLDVQLVFKASFDKANRTRLDAYRGPGLQEGLQMLDQVRQQTGLP
ncbi:MAG TPA: 3-deoxy-8-phosphooctulonate synthase, partial [Planctomycetes bacterium]|nr:3-deoxy-8-phosphooctulonate synthase [Planctomycetota bacterium]